MLQKFRCSLFSMAVATVFLSSLSTAHAAQQYKITDIGLLPGGSGTWSFAINDSGDVAAGYSSIDGGNRALLWSHGTLSNLGALSGAESYAQDINNAGTVVGYSNSKAVIWQQGSMTELTNTSGTAFNTAYGINQVGQIIGSSQLQAAVWDHGQIKTLGNLPQSPFSIGLDINDGGTAVGVAFGFPIEFRAVLWADGQTTELIGLAGSTESGAKAVNNAGTVIGYSAVADLDQAVVWENQVARLLTPVAGGSAGLPYDINEAGQIVGLSNVGTTTHATLWQGSQTYDLNDWLLNGQGWFLSRALSINESGQIAGLGFVDGQAHGYVLTPVPEPSLLALVGAGLLSLALMRRWRADASGQAR